MPKSKKPNPEPESPSKFTNKPSIFGKDLFFSKDKLKQYKPPASLKMGFTSNKSLNTSPLKPQGVDSSDDKSAVALNKSELTSDVSNISTITSLKPILTSTPNKTPNKNLNSNSTNNKKKKQSFKNVSFSKNAPLETLVEEAPSEHYLENDNERSTDNQTLIKEEKNNKQNDKKPEFNKEITQAQEISSFEPFGFLKAEKLLQEKFKSKSEEIEKNNAAISMSDQYIKNPIEYLSNNLRIPSLEKKNNKKGDENEQESLKTSEKLNIEDQKESNIDELDEHPNSKEAINDNKVKDESENTSKPVVLTNDERMPDFDLIDKYEIMEEYV